MKRYFLIILTLLTVTISWITSAFADETDYVVSSLVTCTGTPSDTGVESTLSCYDTPTLKAGTTLTLEAKCYRRTQAADEGHHREAYTNIVYYWSSSIASAQTNYYTETSEYSFTIPSSARGTTSTVTVECTDNDVLEGDDCPSSESPCNHDETEFTFKVKLLSLNIGPIVVSPGRNADVDIDTDDDDTDTDTDTGTDDDSDGLSETDGDCDDSNSSAYPDAEEICDDVDNDCDGEIDEDAIDLSTWYADSDSDGYGNADSEAQACDQPDGYVSDSSDCDDADVLVNTSATEICDDGVDNDCDGTTDYDIPTWYLDYDGDTYGDETRSTQVCDQPDGYVSDSSDCDDIDSSISPAGTEIEDDDIDQDCSGADSTTVAADEDEEEGEAAEEEDGSGSGCGCDIFGARQSHAVNTVALILILMMPLGLLIVVRRSLIVDRV